MPIADPGAADGPTQVVVHTFNEEVFDAAEHPDRPLQLQGTVRDVLWEGLEGAVKKNLAAQHPLSPEVKLLELHGVANADDKLWTYGAAPAGFIFGLLAEEEESGVTRVSLDERLNRAWLRHPLVAFVRHRKVITFYSQLHALIRAGIALPTAFTQLTEYAPDATMARGLTAIARDIRGGDSLGDAMRKARSSTTRTSS